MRKPRSFTCWSARPTNSSVPSARQRARSPVRYIRAARLLCVRVGHKALRRQPRPIQITSRQARSRHIQLASHPNRHRLQSPIQHIHPQCPRWAANRLPQAGARQCAIQCQSLTLPLSPWSIRVDQHRPPDQRAADSLTVLSCNDHALQVRSVTFAFLQRRRIHRHQRRMPTAVWISTSPRCSAEQLPTPAASSDQSSAPRGPP